MSIPAFQALDAAVAPYDFAQSDTSLHTMDPAAQVALVILCALGASCKPRSGIFGFRVDPATAPFADIAAVGVRREVASARLAELAWNLTGRLGMVWDTESTAEDINPQEPCTVVGV